MDAPASSTAGGSPAVGVNRSCSAAAAGDNEMALFERERNHLMRKIEFDETKLRKATKAAEASRKKLLEAQRKMATYSEMFLHSRTNKRSAEAHRMGRQNAVMDNKKIIAKYMEHLHFEYSSVDVKYNRALDVNMEIKRQINLLRRERVIYDRLFRQMERELKSIKREIQRNNRLVEKYYEQRDAAQMDMADLQQEMEQTRVEIKQEWDVLTEAIEAAIVKTQSAHDKPLEDVQVGLLSMEEEEQLKSSMKQYTWLLGVDKVRLKNLKSQLMQYEETWEAISRHTGHDTPEDLMQAFRQAEEAKFSKVDASTALSQEIEQLEMDLKDLYRSIQIQVSQSNPQQHGEDVLSDTKLQEAHNLEVKLAEVRRATEKISRQRRNLGNFFQALFDPLVTLFTRLGCDHLFGASIDDDGGEKASTDEKRGKESVELPAMLASSSLKQLIDSGLNIHNIAEYLGVIEQRASEIVKQYIASSAVEKGRQSPEGLVNYKDTVQSHNLRPMEPSGNLRRSIQRSVLAAAAMGEILPSSSTADEHPQTREEFEKQARKTLNSPHFKAMQMASDAAVEVLATPEQTLPALNHTS